jgi:Na+/H+ antiporter NhaD/arsenite permease-like protein
VELFTPQVNALLIFIVTYIILATEYRERTIAAMAGAGAVWALGILRPEEMGNYVDLKAIGLLFGMMVIIGALREGRFFQWLSGYVAKWCNWKPYNLFIAFMALTAILSAFLDNVTTVLFMVTVTLDLAESLQIDPKPYIISEIFASNIGGMSTLIGDPPNIMIASATGYSFAGFVANVAPISISAFLITYLYLRRKYDLRKTDVEAAQKEFAEIKLDRRLVFPGIATLAGVIILFILQDIVGVYPAAVALGAATFLLFVGGPRMPDILSRVEWSTLIFFTSLFIVVGALDKTGWLALISQNLIGLVGSNTSLGITVVLWISSFSSALIDNIPFSAAFIPVLGDLGRSGVNVYPLWWALSAGTGLGGNGTIIGASANVIAAGIAQARGVKIAFVEFAKIGLLTLVVTTAVANLLLVIRFLIIS